MNARHIAPRLVAASAMILVAAFAAASCAERSTAPPAISNEADLPSQRGPRPTESAARSTDSSAKRAPQANARFERSEWVGAEHNLALAAVMAESRSLRKLGKPGQCRAVDRALRRHFGGRAATRSVSLDHSAVELGQRAALLQLGCAESDLAMSAPASISNGGLIVRPASLTVQSLSISSPAQEVLGQIESAIYTSSSPAAVQSAVQSILSVAPSFDFFNAAVVGSAGSTTVSSSYYWDGYYGSRGGPSTEEPMSLFVDGFWDRARPAIRADLLGGVFGVIRGCGGPVPNAACASWGGLASMFLGGASTGSALFALATQ